MPTFLPCKIHQFGNDTVDGSEILHQLMWEISGNVQVFTVFDLFQLWQG